MDCPHCGTSNRDEDEFCRKCGKSIKVKISKLKAGWMVWWRVMLPVEIVVGLLGWWYQLNFVTASLATLPLLAFLMNWAGKVVARKKYGFTVIAIPLMGLGWGIFWRATLMSMPLKLFYFMFIAFAGVSGNIFALLAQALFVPVYVFLMIIILGWATKRTIELRLLS